MVEFYVVDIDCFNIIGLKTSEQLGFIVRVKTILKEAKCWVSSEYRKLFDSQVGYIPQKVTIKVDPKVKPVVLPARTVPYALLPRVKAKFETIYFFRH